MDLSGLKDIHAPNHELSVFPLAIGWWILIILPFVIYFLVKGIIYIKRTSTRFFALKEMNNILNNNDNIQMMAKEMSILLKRIAIKQITKDSANLYGKEWAEFIIEKSRSKDKEAVEYIATASYLPTTNIPSCINMDSIKKIAADFIRYNT